MTGAGQPIQRKSSHRAALCGLLLMMVLLILRPIDGMVHAPDRTDSTSAPSNMVVRTLPVHLIDLGPAPQLDHTAWSAITEGWSKQARFGQICIKFEWADASDRAIDAVSGDQARTPAVGLAQAIPGQAALADLPRTINLFADAAAISSLAHHAPPLPPPRV